MAEALEVGHLARVVREFCVLLAFYWEVKLTTKKRRTRRISLCSFALRDACDLGSAGCWPAVLGSLPSTKSVGKSSLHARCRQASRVLAMTSSSRIFAQRLFWRDAESPSRTGVSTRDACAPRKQKRTPREKQRLFTITPRIIVEDALLITCVGIAMRELRARRDTSC